MNFLKAIVFSIFLIVSLLGMTLSFHQDSHFVAPCFLQKMESYCDMDALTHIKIWDSIFTATVEQIFAWSAALVILIVGFVSFVSVLESISCSVIKRNIIDPPWVILYQQLFSRGILNPKIFSLNK